jgi:hypothetical protein
MKNAVLRTGNRVDTSPPNGNCAGIPRDTWSALGQTVSYQQLNLFANSYGFARLRKIIFSVHEVNMLKHKTLLWNRTLMRQESNTSTNDAALQGAFSHE